MEPAPGSELGLDPEPGSEREPESVLALGLELGLEPERGSERKPEPVLVPGLELGPGLEPVVAELEQVLERELEVAILRKLWWRLFLLWGVQTEWCCSTQLQSILKVSLTLIT